MRMMEATGSKKIKNYERSMKRDENRNKIWRIVKKQGHTQASSTHQKVAIENTKHSSKQTRKQTNKLAKKGNNKTEF